MFFGANDGKIEINGLLSNDTLEKGLIELFQYNAGLEYPDDDDSDIVYKGFSGVDGNYTVFPKKETDEDVVSVFLSVERDLQNNTTVLNTISPLHDLSALKTIEEITKYFGGKYVFNNIINAEKKEIIEKEFPDKDFDFDMEKQKIIKEVMKNTTKNLFKDLKSAGLSENDINSTLTLIKEQLEEKMYSEIPSYYSQFK